jgi:hypothetical protein
VLLVLAALTYAQRQGDFIGDVTKLFGGSK